MRSAPTRPRARSFAQRDSAAASSAARSWAASRAAPCRPCDGLGAARRRPPPPPRSARRNRGHCAPRRGARRCAPPWHFFSVRARGPLLLRALLLRRATAAPCARFAPARPPSPSRPRAPPRRARVVDAARDDSTRMKAAARPQPRPPGARLPLELIEPRAHVPAKASIAAVEQRGLRAGLSAAPGATTAEIGQRAGEDDALAPALRCFSGRAVSRRRRRSAYRNSKLLPQTNVLSRKINRALGRRTRDNKREQQWLRRAQEYLQVEKDGWCANQVYELSCAPTCRARPRSRPASATARAASCISRLELRLGCIPTRAAPRFLAPAVLLVLLPRLLHQPLLWRACRARSLAQQLRVASDSSGGICVQSLAARARCGLADML